MEKMEFLKAFQELCIAFRMPADENTVKVYYKYLQDFSIEEFREAIKNIILNPKNEYFPKISVLHKECRNAKRKTSTSISKLIEQQSCEQETEDIANFFKK